MICHRCKKDKPKSSYYTNRKARYWCIECHREHARVYQRQYYAANKKKCHAAMRKYYEDHKDRMLSYQKEYYYGVTVPRAQGKKVKFTFTYPKGRKPRVA